MDLDFQSFFNFEESSVFFNVFLKIGRTMREENKNRTILRALTEETYKKKLLIMENVLKKLDFANRKHLYHSLYKIRSEYIKNSADIVSILVLKICKNSLLTFLLLYLKTKFEGAGGIKKLMKILSKIQLDDSDNQASQNEKIIEVILSILGNCTYKNEKCANQAFENNISEVIIAVLNNNTDNNSIMTKACRLIGNLAQYQKIALNLQSKGLALSVSNLLSEEGSRSMLTMAVRIIRLMWQSKRFRFEIISFGSIHKVMTILYNVLKSECVSDPEVDSNVIILKRRNEPDRTISREKLGSMIEKIDKQEVEVTYEIQKPPKRKSIELQLPEDKDSLDLVSGIIKCIHTLTESSSSQVARSICADGLGTECLTHLSGENSKHRAMSLNILSNLSTNTLSQGYLAVNNDLISNVANMLLNAENLDHPLDEREKKYCLNILCFSSENACNRGKLRRSGVFKSLLNIANTTSVEREIAMLIFTFYQFRFDELGLDSLLELGFIHVMIKILGDMIVNKEVDHIKFDDPSLDEEKKEEQKSKQKKRPPPEAMMKYAKYPRYDPGSPSSSSSGYTNLHQTSLSDTSGYSPYNSPSRSYFDYEDSNSDIYSPVCSDNEEEEKKAENDFDILTFIYENNEIGKEDERKDIEIHDENSNTSTNDNQQEQAQNATEIKQVNENIPETLKQILNDPISFILQLIWQVSISNGDSNEFVRPGNLLILHKCCKIISKPNGKLCKILENVLTQTRNFVAILKQNFVFDIYELSSPKYDHLDCYSCSKMKSMSRSLLTTYGTVAESGYGRGELVHFLLTGDDELKKKISINLIYIISCSQILNDMLFRFKVLDVVIDVILSEETMALEACDGITVMSQNLRIEIPSEDDVLKRIIPDEFVVDEKLILTTAEGEKVKFVLKDGIVDFDKESLKSASEVFNSMLSGDFRENNENEIKFPEYTVEGMKYFFQILKMSEMKKLKVIAPRVDDMNVILQSYELSILYILTDLQKPLLNVIKVILDETNVMKIFEWSLRNINQDLLISAICYFLCGQLESTKKLQLFKEANQSRFNKEWRQLLIDVISMKCQPAST